MQKQELEDLIEQTSDVIDRSVKENNIEKILNYLVPVLKIIMSSRLLKLLIGKKFSFVIQSFLLIYDKIKKD